MHYRIQKGIRIAGAVGIIVILSVVQWFRLQSGDAQEKGLAEDDVIFSMAESITGSPLSTQSDSQAEKEETKFQRGESEEYTVEKTEKEEETEFQKDESKESTVEKKENEGKAIRIHVSGAVLEPDRVYVLKEGDRIEDAIREAGGLAEGADLTNVNLAGRLQDGMKIYVPVKGEERPVITEDSNASAGTEIDWKSPSESGVNGLTNINRASIMELDNLPGIGPALAQRIIDYREANGFFSNIEDLKQVKGIGDKMFEKIKDRITVS